MDLETFLSGDHISYCTIVRGQGILRNVAVSGYIAFHQISKFFVNKVNFFLVTKCFLRSDETASRAGFGSWTVAWRPWFSALKSSVKYLKIMRGWQARLYQRVVDIPAFFIHKKTSSSKTNLCMTRPLLRHRTLLYIRNHLYCA